MRANKLKHPSWLLFPLHSHAIETEQSTRKSLHSFHNPRGHATSPAASSKSLFIIPPTDVQTCWQIFHCKETTLAVSVFWNNILSQSDSGTRYDPHSHGTHSLRSYSLSCLLSYLYKIFPFYWPVLISSFVWRLLLSPLAHIWETPLHTYCVSPFASWYSWLLDE